MLIKVNPELCTGCRACEEFCSINQEGLINPELSRIHVYKDYVNNIFLPILCVPCSEKPCISACPEEQAIILDKNTGAVIIQEEFCTGCSKCIRACEIGAIGFLKQKGRGKKEKAVAVKCNQCNGDPWCVKVCEPQALQYIESNSEMDGQVIFDQLCSDLSQLDPNFYGTGIGRGIRKK
ncbi:MAG: hypothetical protein A2X25_12705 [Chloroflexi bacterium GWB2_49_20]|nr:MAG: hypothetical protein A2X25_12705 [Chloroflexi bacterium GWB2_49_20]OGN78422.1 MAG: hypothetical protein A2X26_01495 [Chloroflexi bacterium GWC2_49_37]OGN84115.1 MAG: hypothetical protein A2X27_14190 [Chloroflexi bacterium GWD2_49_16]